jgi:hypothetical protein
MTKKYNLRQPKFALVEFGVQLVSSKLFQYQSQIEGPEKVTRGGGGSMGVNQNSTWELGLYSEIDLTRLSSSMAKTT